LAGDTIDNFRESCYYDAHKSASEVLCGMRGHKAPFGERRPYVARPNFDKMILVVALTALCAALMGLTGMAPASAATLPAPGLQEPQNLGRFAPRESFRQPMIVGVGTSELRLAGRGINSPSVRGFKAPVTIIENNKTMFVLKSVTPSGTPTNGNFGLLITAPKESGIYKIEYRTFRADNRPGWRSDMVYEVTDDLVEEETPAGATDGSAGKKNCCPPAPHIGDAAPPIRTSVRLEGIRTLGQDAKSTSPDMLRGEITVATQVATETDLRFGLRGNENKPDPTASDYGWQDGAGGSIGVGRKFGELSGSLDFEWIADLSFQDEDGWTRTPFTAIAGLKSDTWHLGWLKGEGFLALSTRHVGARAVAKAKIAGDGTSSHLAIVAGAHGNKGWTKGLSYGQYLAGAEGGINTSLGYISLGALAGAGDGEPVSALVTFTVRN